MEPTSLPAPCQELLRLRFEIQTRQDEIKERYERVHVLEHQFVMNFLKGQPKSKVDLSAEQELQKVIGNPKQLRLQKLSQRETLGHKRLRALFLIYFKKRFKEPECIAFAEELASYVKEQTEKPDKWTVQVSYPKKRKEKPAEQDQEEEDEED
jgi:hypothetical protein